MKGIRLGFLGLLDCRCCNLTRYSRCVVNVGLSRFYCILLAIVNNRTGFALDVSLTVAFCEVLAGWRVLVAFVDEFLKERIVKTCDVIDA